MDDKYLKRHTQQSTAEFLDYMDGIDELEMQRQLELYDRGERIKMWLTSVIMVLAIAVVIVATHQLVKG